MYDIKIEKFEGPLDLLLRLIERDEMDITEVSLVRVTNQYISHLERLPEIPPEELADFLVIGAKLLYIKSKHLLPLLVWEEEEEDSDLEHRLKMYREYVEAGRKIEEMLGMRRWTFVREKAPVSEMGFVPPSGFDGEQMADLYRQILARLEPVVRTPEAVIERTVSIHEKIGHIKSFLEKHGKFSFHALLEKAESRNEIVVSFLALLELIKRRHLDVRQEENFREIELEKVTR
jgi:segregation and condensation protein A